jgi:para-nitrobenzyl esterase
LYGTEADEVLKWYNPGSDAEVEQVATDLAGDRFISFSTWRWAEKHGKTSGQPVFRYLYEKPRPPMVPEMGDASPGLAGGVQRGGPPQPLAKGAVHSAEIEYAMGNLSTNKVFAWTEDDYKVSRTLQGYFVSFIKNGNPNGPGLPQWKAANRSAGIPVMHINVASKLRPEQNRSRYLYLEKAASR